MAKKRTHKKLNVEILYNPIDDTTDIIIWEGMVIVDRQSVGGPIENSEAKRQYYRERYIAEMNKGDK